LEDFVFVDGASLDTAAGYRLLIGCVTPRPIAWVTTVSAAGIINVAPFSSYNYVSTSPPMLAFNVAMRSGSIKDTARNILETGEFVVNVATEANIELMHRCGEDFAADVSEAQALGIELLGSRIVSPPRIACSPVQMECRLDQSIVLGRGVNTLFIGEVVAFHLSPSVFDGDRIDSVKMRPVARLGGPYYAGLGEIFHRPMLQRPPGGEGWGGGGGKE
jgi:flavin reductase (DIM6/NTAB) family NADH-FMN oxidoreductase RutF